VYIFASIFAKSLLLTGQIPASLGNCVKLEDLWLNDNNLQGKCIIRVHFRLYFAKSLFLTGQIPESLGKCIKLKEFFLFGNQLEGKL
jgi:hypothetical protein